MVEKLNPQVVRPDATLLAPSVRGRANKLAGMTKKRISNTRGCISRGDFLVGSMACVLLPTLPTPGVFAKQTFAVNEIAEGVFVHQGQHALQSHKNNGDIANCGFIVGNDSVAVIDTGGSAIVGAQLLAQISTATRKPIKFVINTHMHPDHVFGNAPFKADGVAFVAHHKLGRGLQARAEHYLKSNVAMMGEAALAGTEIVLPDTTVTDTLELDLGGRKLICQAYQTAHTDNDLTVLDVNTESLFVGDLVFSGHLPTIDGSILGWLKVLETIERHSVARIVPGHGPASLGLNKAVQPIKTYLGAVVAGCRDLINSGNTITDAIKIVARSERKKWETFDQYHARNIAAAFAELEWE